MQGFIRITTLHTNAEPSVHIVEVGADENVRVVVEGFVSPEASPPERISRSETLMGKAPESVPLESVQV